MVLNNEKTLNDFLNNVVNDEELLVYPRKDYLSVYCNGNPFPQINFNGSIGKIGQLYKKYFNNVDIYNKFNRISASERLDNLMENSIEIKESIGKGLPQIKERKRQQVIAHNHRIYNHSNENYLICNFEYALPEELIGKKAEVDLVAIDIKDINHPVITLLEYKCTRSALSSSKSDLMAHYNDFCKIHENKAIEDIIKRDAINSYNYLLDINALCCGNRLDQNIDLNDVILQFGFLFTDLKRDQYIGKLKDIAQNDQLGVKVWFFDSFDQVILNDKNKHCITDIF